MTKVKIFNFSGLLIIVGAAVCTSLLISIDTASANGNTISWLEVLRASLSGLLAMCGFFTRSEIEVKDDEQ